MISVSNSFVLGTFTRGLCMATGILISGVAMFANPAHVKPASIALKVTAKYHSKPLTLVYLAPTLTNTASHRGEFEATSLILFAALGLMYILTLAGILVRLKLCSPGTPPCEPPTSPPDPPDSGPLTAPDYLDDPSLAGGTGPPSPPPPDTSSSLTPKRPGRNWYLWAFLALLLFVTIFIYKSYLRIYLSFISTLDGVFMESNQTIINEFTLLYAYPAFRQAVLLNNALSTFTIQEGWTFLPTASIIVCIIVATYHLARYTRYLPTVVYCFSKKLKNAIYHFVLDDSPATDDFLLMTIGAAAAVCLLVTLAFIQSHPAARIFTNFMALLRDIGPERIQYYVFLRHLTQKERWTTLVYVAVVSLLIFLSDLIAVHPIWPRLFALFNTENITCDSAGPRNKPPPLGLLRCMVVEELIWVFYEMIYPYSDFNLKFQFIVLSIVVVATLQIFARDLTHLLRETPMSFGFWCVCVYLIYMTTIAFVVPNFGLGLVDSIVLQWRCVNSFQRIWILLSATCVYILEILYRTIEAKSWVLPPKYPDNVDAQI